MPPPTAPPPPSRSTPPPSRVGAPSASTPTLPRPSFTTSEPVAAAPRIMLSGVEGIGKTTAAAHAPGAAIIQIAGETGYETLRAAGRVPLIPHMRVQTWEQLLSVVDGVIESPGDIQNLAIDTITAVDRLCAQHVCDRDFKGDWSEHGYASYGKGETRTAAEIPILLSRLDRLRDKGVGIIALAHIRVKPFKNPVGPDYDKYQIDVGDKSAGAFNKWFDAILFGTFYTVVEGGEVGEKAKKGKGTGGFARVVYTEQCDGWVAKNRYGMPRMIQLSNDHTSTWGEITQHIKKGTV